MHNNVLPTVTFCMVHLNRIGELKKAVRHHSPHVDRTIIIDGGSKDGSIEWLQSDECKNINVETYIYPWVDNFSTQRNNYLKHAGYNTWVLVADCDEYMEEAAIYTIKQIASEAEARDVSLVWFNSHDIYIMPDGHIKQKQSDYWHPMFFKMGPEVKYIGNPHTSLNRIPGEMWNHNLKYYHIKTWTDEWLRGARNYWVGARVGQNLQDDQWREFRDLCTRYNFTYFYELAEVMKSGSVPLEIKQWFINHKEDENKEARSYFVCYLVFMHPEMNENISTKEFSYNSSREPVKNMMF